MEIIDPGSAVARQTAWVLKSEGLSRNKGQGRYTFYTSGDPEVFSRLARDLSSVEGVVLGARWSKGALVASR